MQSWAAPGLLHAGRRLCLPQARPRAHHHGIRETQARLDGKSVLNFWPASGSHGQVHGGGGLQAVQPAQLLGPGPQHPPSLAPGGEGGLGWLRPRLCDFGVGAPGVPSSPWPLAWRMGATPVPGGLGTNEATCEARPQRVLKQGPSPRGVGSASCCASFPVGTQDTGAMAATQPGAPAPRFFSQAQGSSQDMWAPTGAMASPPTSPRAAALSTRASLCCQGFQAQP